MEVITLNFWNLFGLQKTAPWFRLKKYIIKKSSRLSLLNDFSSLKSKEFNLKDIEVDVDSEEQHWFKRAHVGEYLGLVYIHRSTAKLGDEDQKSRAFLQAEGGCRSLTALREDAQGHDISVSLTGILYVIVNSRKDKGKEIQEQHQQAIQERDNRLSSMRTLHCRYNEMFIRHSYKDAKIDP